MIRAHPPVMSISRGPQARPWKVRYGSGRGFLGKALALHGKYVYIHVVCTGARTPKLLKVYPEKAGCQIANDHHLA